MIGCLLGNVISNVMVARSETLAGVAWGRIIGGVTGGLTPIAQAAVADVVIPDLKMLSHSIVVQQEHFILFFTVPRFFYQLLVIVLLDLSTLASREATFKKGVRFQEDRYYI